MKHKFSLRWGHGHAHVIIILLGVLIGALLGMRYMDISKHTPAIAQSGSALAAVQQDFVQVAQKVKPSVVTIVAQTVIKGGRMPAFGDEDFGQLVPPEFRKFFEMPAPDQTVTGLGSGFIIREDGYILTNNHVVGDAQKLEVMLPNDDKRYAATVVGRDERTDITVVKIDRKGLPAVEFSDSDQLQVGQWAIAIGSPFGLEQSVTVGVVSAIGRHPDNGDPRMGSGDFIQTDASINKGNSGGPLVDIYGRVVGVNTFIFSSESGGNIGIGFAIPSNTAKTVSTELIEKGKVSRGRLGIIIQNLTSEMKGYFGVDQGALVSDVQPGSPAEKADIQRGDVIVKLNGKDVKSTDVLSRLISELGPGKKATVSVLRKGKTIDLTAVTTEMESQPQASAAPSPSPTTGQWTGLGIGVTSLDDARAKGLRLPADKSGVMVTDVEGTSNAYSAGLRQGMVIAEVNGTAVSSVDAFKGEIGKIKSGDYVLLLVFAPDGTSRYVAFQA